MGLVSAGDELNRLSEEALAGIEHRGKVVEDVLLFDSDFEEYVKRVRFILQDFSAHGITMNPRKIVFAQPSVSYCLYKVLSQGYRVDDHLISASKNFPPP